MMYIGAMLLVAIAAATLAVLFGRQTKRITDVTNNDVPAYDSSSAAHLEVSLVKVYEVFLSFCGKDTRNGFTDFLFTYLKDASIETFRDHNELRVGEKISSELLKAIRESKISIPVFSKNYAFSKWCLLELAEMVDCHKSGGHMIYPIFYGVAPFEVRHQYGSYEKAFQEHKKKFNKETVERWREALKMVGELKGLELKETNGQEGKLVKMVVEKVLLYLKKNYTVLPQNLVGIDTHLEKLKELLHFDFGGARVVVIHGMGGLGKTTIAKVAYNQLHDRFDNHCFLDNIRETEHRDGILDLQKQLISKINNKGLSKICDVNEGRDIIKGTICRRKVLLVLDDVDKFSQVNMLMGNLSWYGAQNKIVITTRDTNVLSAIEKTCQIECLNDVCTGYNPSYMDEHESLQLFSKYAFMRDCPAKGYEMLCKEVIAIAAGLPLVLVVLGSTFFVVEGKDLWNEKLRKLREMPNEEVIDKLRFSFDALENTQKQIFLDIACIFIGSDVTIASYMWDDCKFYSRDGINVLVRKSLITVNEDNVLGMHDQLRDLGRQIIREESLNELGKQSRLWRSEEAMQILETNQGTASVNVLCLPESETPVLASSFSNILNLRHLDLGYGYLDGDFKDLLSGLRWLRMSSFREGLSTNLHLKNLVILNLNNNNFIEEFRDFKIGEKLKVFVLSECHSVRVLPDLSKHPSLEILRLSSCDSLCAIDGLEKLKSLKCLGAYGCPTLEKVCLSNLTNLCKFDLFMCNQLTEIQSLEKLESLQDLRIFECPSLKELPDLSNFKRLEKIVVSSNWNLIEIKGLEKLELLCGLVISDCGSLEMLPDFSNLKRLEYIDVYGCHKLIEINGLDKLELLRGLDISDCGSLIRLPDFSNLKILENIGLDGCSKLIEIKGLKKLVLVKDLCLKNCESLERLPDLSNLKKLKTVDVKGCVKLVEIEGLEKLELLEDLCMEDCGSLRSLPDLSNLKKLKSFDVKGCVKLYSIQGLEKLESLEFLCMEDCKFLRGLPDLSNLKKLKGLDVKGCVQLYNIQGLEKLESLKDLCVDCRCLRRLPDLSNLKKLKACDVNGCVKLVEIEGLEKLELLEYLYMKECTSLERLPDLSNLKKLKILDVKGCVKLVEIEGLEKLESLEDLCMDDCKSLRRLPDLSNLKKLKKLTADRCMRLVEIKGLEKLESLRFLELRECRSLRGTINMSNLDKFEVYHVPTLELTNFDFLKKFKELEIMLENNVLKFRGFNVNGWRISGESITGLLIDEAQDHSFEELMEILGLDSLEFLTLLGFTNCSYLKRITNLPNFGALKCIKLDSCDELDEIEGLVYIESLETLVITCCYKIRQILDLRKLKNLKRLSLTYLKLISIHGLDELQFLQFLQISGCMLIETLPDLSNLEKLVELDASGCVTLCKITGLEELTSLKRLNIAGCKSIEALPELLNIVVQRSHNVYEDIVDLGPSYETSETSETSTNSMLYIEDHYWTWLVDPLDSIDEHGETSSSMPVMRKNVPQTWIGVGLTSSSEEILKQITPKNTSKRKRI